LDLEWADLIVSSLSSVLIEALFAGVPVIAHVSPGMFQSVFAQARDPRRRFFYTDDFPPVARAPGAAGTR
jgi:hypothetical protein